MRAIAMAIMFAALVYDYHQPRPSDKSSAPLVLAAAVVTLFLIVLGR